MKNITRRRTIVCIIAILCLALFTLASCSNKSARTTYAQENATSGCFGGAKTKSKIDWLKEKVEANVEEDLAAYLLWVKENDPDNYDAVKANENELKMSGVTYTKDGNEYLTASYKANLKNLITTYAVLNKIANTDDENAAKENYLVAQIVVKRDEYYNYLASVTTASSSSIDDLAKGLNGQAGCFDTSTESYVLSEVKKADQCTDVYRLAALYVLEVDTILNYLEPVVFKGRTAGEFFSHLWNNLFIFPIAWLIYAISKLCGGLYAVGLIIATLLVRTLGWPIYAKTNDMTSKMGELQPELTKIQEKYAGRDDPDSKRMMQAEQAQVYRKNKVGIGGCILPFLQFPIFMAIFRAISRIPYTVAISGTMYTNNWASELNSKLFFIDLFQNRNIGGVGQLIGVIILALLVVGTQVLSQVLAQRRQKLSKEKAQADIPEYRRQAYNQTQNQSNSSMKMMMYMMVVMMGLFVWTSKAGLGLYWLIGNLYSTAQTTINSKQQEKKKALKAEQEARNKGIYTIHTENEMKPKKEKKNKK